MDLSLVGRAIDLGYFPLVCVILISLGWSIRAKPIDLVAILILGLYFIAFLSRFVIQL
jgi:uncharacterized membrane protein